MQSFVSQGSFRANRKRFASPVQSGALRNEEAKGLMPHPRIRVRLGMYSEFLRATGLVFGGGGKRFTSLVVPLRPVFWWRNTNLQFWICDSE